MDYSVSEEVLLSHSNVFPLLLGEERVWVKKRRRRDNPGLLLLQRLTHFLTRRTLAVAPGPLPADSVAFEAGRLRRAAVLGVRVPAVLHAAEGYFVLEDAGETLHRIVHDRPAEADDAVHRAASALGRLHDAGIAHGGAQIKNIALRPDAVFFFDFEENIPDDKLELFQLRDLFLFLFSLEKAGFDPDFRRICERYRRGDAVLGNLVAALRELWMLRIFKYRPFSALRLGDVRALCALVDKADREYGRVQR